MLVAITQVVERPVRPAGPSRSRGPKFGAVADVNWRALACEDVFPARPRGERGAGHLLVARPDEGAFGLARFPGLARVGRPGRERAEAVVPVRFAVVAAVGCHVVLRRVSKCRVEMMWFRVLREFFVEGRLFGCC